MSLDHGAERNGPVNYSGFVDLALDLDGIARLVTQPPGLSGTAAAVAKGHPTPSVALVSNSPTKVKRRKQKTKQPASKVHGAADREFPGSKTSAIGSATAPVVVRHSQQDGISLLERVQGAQELAAQRADDLGTHPEVVVEVIDHCDEAKALDIKRGEVTLRGLPQSSDADRIRVELPGLHVTGGALCVSNLQIVASQENRVEAGLLQCCSCALTSQHGCGVLCLQRARVFLRDCEVSKCMRSGIGVNGKNTEIHLQDCVVSKNNFSGLGVNQRPRSMTLQDNRIVGNRYHGVWVNIGVEVTWLGGEISGNRLADKGGQGLLIGFDDASQPATPELGIFSHPRQRPPDSDQWSNFRS